MLSLVIEAKKDHFLWVFCGTHTKLTARYMYVPSAKILSDVAVVLS